MISAIQDAGLFLLGAPPAGTSAGGSQNMVQTFVFMGLIFVVFWFFMIRPQRQKQKRREAMLKSLEKGDRVVTIGGVRGLVAKADEQIVTIKVDDNCKIDFSRSAIAEVLLDEKETARRMETSAPGKKAGKKEDKAEKTEKEHDKGEEGAL